MSSPSDRCFFDRARPTSRLLAVVASIGLAAVLVTACGPTPPPQQSTPAPPPTVSAMAPAPRTAAPMNTPGSPSTLVSGDLSATTLRSAGTILASLLQRTGPRDPRFYRAGVFHDGTPECFRCTLGPAVLAATYGVAKGDHQATDVAVRAFDRAISTHQQEDGSITPPAPGEGGPGIQTILFSNALAHTYLILGKELDGPHRRSWARSLTRSADYLIKQNTASYYVNGNINLSLSMELDLAYRITGLERFRPAAEQALAFTLHPPQARWPGFGLAYSRRPVSADGLDGAGYLAETGGGAPGFDPAYTVYQLDIVSLWYSLTGAPTLKRLANLLFNQVFPRVRTSDWTIDVSGGTRRGAPGTRYGFLASALPVLALEGGRDDLRGWVTPQADAVIREFTRATTFAHAGLSDDFGSELAVSVAVIHRASR